MNIKMTVESIRYILSDSKGKNTFPQFIKNVQNISITNKQEIANLKTLA